MPFLVPAATTCFLLGAVILFLGIAILRDGGRDRLHRVTALMLFFGGLGALLVGLGLAVRASAPEGTELFTQISVQFASVWEFFFPALLLFTLVFPTELPLLKRFPWIQELIFVPYVFHLLLTIIAVQSGSTFWIPEIAERVSWAGSLLTPFRVGLSLLYDVHAILFSFVNLGYVVITLTVLAWRSGHILNPRLQAQTRVVLLGLGTCLVFYSLAVPVPVILGKFEEWERFTAPLLVLGLAAGGGSIAYAIIRHRFLDARLLIRRSLIFVAVASVVAVVYLQVMDRVTGFVESFSGLDIRLIEPLFLVAALVLLQPLVSRAEEFLDRILRRERREGRIVLEQLSRDIVTLMDLPILGERLTRAVFESMVTEGAALLTRRSPGGKIELVALAGFPNVPRDLWEELAVDLPAVGAADRPLLIRQIAVASNSEEAARLADTALRLPLGILVPLRHGEEMVGALAIGPKATRTRFSPEDVRLLATLGNQTAAAVRNTHLLEENLRRAAMEEELHLAREIQSSYLPSVFPRHDSLEMAGTNVPSKQVGGDYYDYIETGDEVLFVVADVVGKGVPAALLMSMLQASLRTMATGRHTLTEMIEQLNVLILQTGESGRFATVFLARFNPSNRHLQYSNAGHNYPCLLRSTGEVEWLKEGGLLLGAFEDALTKEGAARLEPGDRLVLYTDGITEAANPAGDFFGEEGLAELLKALPPEANADSIVGAVMDGARNFCEGADPGDDMTVVVLRVPALVEAPVS
jgi:sigma-B regulation protein RsbU (phosphoserine phosphatase)